MSTTTTAAPRFDKLNVGDVITIQCYYRGEAKEPEQAFFLGIIGEGDDRRAKLATVFDAGGEGRMLEWEIYRYSGRWAYGSSADRISIV